MVSLPPNRKRNKINGNDLYELPISVAPRGLLVGVIGGNQGLKLPLALLGRRSAAYS